MRGSMNGHAPAAAWELVEIGHGGSAQGASAGVTSGLLADICFMPLCQKARPCRPRRFMESINF